MSGMISVTLQSLDMHLGILRNLSELAISLPLLKTFELSLHDVITPEVDTTTEAQSTFSWYTL